MVISDRVAEAIVAAGLLAVTSWAGLAGWRLYDGAIAPAARQVPTLTPTPFVDPETAREQGKRQRLVMDHVAAGISLRNGNQRIGAIEEFSKALALDPSNFDARQSLREMGVEPPPGVALQPTAQPPTPVPTATPLRR